MVPNYRTGSVATYDRSEPQLGSWVLRMLQLKFPEDTWLIDLALPALVGWNNWLGPRGKEVE